MDYFTTHKEEYAMLLSNDSRLDGLLLRDELSIYSNEEFTKQVAIFQMNYWQKRLKSIPTMTWDFTTKSKHIAEINDRICKLQKTLRDVT